VLAPKAREVAKDYFRRLDAGEFKHELQVSGSAGETNAEA
jgi:hypothetical protein